MFNIKNLIILLTLAVAGFLQSTGLHYIAIYGVKPDILSVVVVFIALYIGKDGAIKAAIIAGLIKDLISTTLLGSSVASLFLLILVLDRYSGHIFKEKLSMQMLTCAIFYILSTSLLLILSSIASSGLESGFSSYLPVVIKGAIYTGLVAPLIFMLCKQIFKPYFLYL